MKISDIIERRQPEWQKLREDIEWLRSNPNIKKYPQRLTRFARRYRAVCSDLATSMTLGFPPQTIEYLHQLVADGHVMLYQGKNFSIWEIGRVLFVDVPRRILFDPCTWIAMLIFWGLFFGSIVGGMIIPDYCVEIAGEGTLTQMENMYSDPIGTDSTESSRSTMTGFYVLNNAGIGLRCFACGIFFGVGSLCILAYNAIFLGGIFSHMLVSPQSGNFTNFVTAHGPFELTAVALSGAAGFKLGWSMIDTNGWSRGDSLRRQAVKSLEIALTATVLFVLAAIIEGNISPLSIPYPVKLLVAVLSTLLMAIWFILPSLLERKPGEQDAEDVDQVQAEPLSSEVINEAE